MRLHLRSRAYHLLWKVARKQKMRIQGCDIEYLSLPWWMLLGGDAARTRFVEAFRVTHRKSRTNMIFLSSGKSWLESRYAAYHEHLEGCFEMRTGPAADDESLQRLVTEARERIRPDAPDFGELARAYVERTGDRAHVFALLLELALAKEEMLAEAYKAHIAGALVDRL